MDEYLRRLLDRAKLPISTENPCGDNARDDERYDKAKTEIMKLTAGAAVIDWKGIRLGADALLSEKTKDLTLAAYLSLALLKEFEYPGLLVGMQIVDSFVENWWEPMFPSANRLKARVQVFEWMDERLSALAGITEPKVEHAEELRQCKVVCDALPDKVHSFAKTPVSGFSRLRTELNQWVAKLPTPELPKEEVKKYDEKAEEKDKRKGEPQEPEATATKDADRSGPADAPPLSDAAPRTLKTSSAKIELPAAVDDLETLDEGIKAMIKIVHLIRKVDPLTPIAYRLARILKWELVQSAPPSAADGKTKIPPPNQQSLTLLETQFGAANWTALTQTAEHMFVTQGIFFLDLQRYVYQGLLNQGAEEAAKVVMAETARLLNRLPVVLNLTYLTGLPFANDETRQWVKDAVKTAAGPDTSDEEEDTTWLKEASKTAGKSMASALPILQDAISRAANIKNVMKRQRDVAKFFTSNREYQWAIPLLESLHEKIETIGLAQWDPEFCSDVWELMLRGYDALPLGAEMTGKDNLHIAKIRQKLFEANVARAAAVTPKEKKK